MRIEFHERYDGSAPGTHVPPEYADKKLIHVCEVCGRREILTPEEGYAEGWDYPPFMYPFGVLSPRTCPSCSLMDTAYWAIAAKGSAFEALTKSQKKAVLRILSEPESILPHGDYCE